MSDTGIEINDEILNGGGLLFNSSVIQSDDPEDEPDIVQLPDAADAGIATDDAEIDFQEQAGAVASKMKKKKKFAMAFVTLAVLLAVGVSLGVGLGTKNGNKSVSSANNAVTLEDCLKEEKALQESALVPTGMPTTSLMTYKPTAFSVSEETGEEEELAAATIGASPVAYSNDFAGMTMDVQDSNDGLMRRDLRGSSSSAASKVHKRKASSKSRRLQCDELLGDRTSSSSSGSSKSGKSTKSSKGSKSSKKGTPPTPPPTHPPTLPPTLPPIPNLSFDNRDELKLAVNQYSSQNCTTNSTCATGVTYGWPINTWCVEKVTSFNELFLEQYDFNQTIANWDTSSVTDMERMFVQATVFNQPIASWDTSRVKNMQYMFLFANAFNQPIADWDTSGVTDMQYMFLFTAAFNQPIADWNISNVKTMSHMFFSAPVFNQNLCGWGEYYSSDVEYPNMFLSGACPNQASPTSEDGPWCANCSLTS